MKTRRVVSTVAAIVAAFSLGCSKQRAARVLGTPSNLGNGTVASYAEFDKSGAPKVIGVVFSAAALDALPAAPSDGHRCFDANNDGVIDLATECSAWHERVLPVPVRVAALPAAGVHAARGLVDEVAADPGVGVQRAQERVGHGQHHGHAQPEVVEHQEQQQEVDPLHDQRLVKADEPAATDGETVSAERPFGA